MDVKSFAPITVCMFVLLILLAVLAILGNGFVLGVIARFKKFRTFPNILTANLALADFLNALINIPIYLLWAVLRVKWFTGKALAIISFFLSNLSNVLKIASMMVLLINVFLAIELELKYFTWKTNKKALLINLIIWLVCVTATVLRSIVHSGDDFQDAPVFKYRIAFAAEARYAHIAATSIYIFTSAVFGALVFCSVQKKKRQVRQKVRLELFTFRRFSLRSGLNILIFLLILG